MNNYIKICWCRYHMDIYIERIQKEHQPLINMELFYLKPVHSESYQALTENLMKTIIKLIVDFRGS